MFNAKCNNADCHCAKHCYAEMPSIVSLNVVNLSVVMLNVVMLNVVMLNVVMLNVVMLNVVILSVVGQKKHSSLCCRSQTCCYKGSRSKTLDRVT